MQQALGSSILRGFKFKQVMQFDGVSKANTNRCI